ncbi:hypothetical protein F1996_11110 [Akkermansia sp. BIOML-A58]|nr:hypothetical protein [Akkermansia sp. BIOML-A58]KAA3167364.1 hypothetical protein F1996_11110 [Akkermansia sp. BIOML-A58]
MLVAQSNGALRIGPETEGSCAASFIPASGVFPADFQHAFTVVGIIRVAAEGVASGRVGSSILVTLGLSAFFLAFAGTGAWAAFFFRSAGGGRGIAAGAGTGTARLGIKLKIIPSPFRRAAGGGLFFLVPIKIDQGDNFLSFLVRRSYIRVEVGINIGRLRLVGKNGNAELLSGAQGGMVLMDDLAPVIPLFQHDALRLDGKVLCFAGQFHIPEWDGQGDGGIGVQGKEIGTAFHDLEVPGPFMASVIGSGTWGDENGGGDAVDVEVGLRESVGEHGNEGIAGFLGNLGIVHCLVNQYC